jgi:hypothetical protein
MSFVSASRLLQIAPTYHTIPLFVLDVVRSITPEIFGSTGKFVHPVEALIELQIDIGRCISSEAI